MCIRDSSGKEQSRHGRRSANDRGNDIGKARHLRADREPIARPAYRGRKDFTQRQAAGAPMQLEQAGEFTGNGSGSFPDVKYLGRLPEIDGDRSEVQCRQRIEAATGRSRKEIEDFVAVVGVPPQAGTATAKRSQRQFGNRGGELGRDDRVDRVAAAA